MSVFKHAISLCLFNVILVSQLCGVDVREDEISQFLHCVANAEAKDWPQFAENWKSSFPFLLQESTGKSLSLLNAKVLDSHDLRLIKLFQRAVRNHDSLSKEKTTPFTFHYQHYQPPAFLIPAIHLTFDVKGDRVGVTSELSVKRNSQEPSLILDGRDHVVSEVALNGQVLSQDAYRVTPHELILFDVPEEDFFHVRIKSDIHPFNNATLEGMYQCGEWLTTQCESEGARRIFFTLDRPDVLSQITTTIVADSDRYPYRLSNGDLVGEEQLEDGRKSITWCDPFPKPSYLFACVLGRFSVLSDHFVTKSGKDVALQVYVEPGKESRAHYALFALKKAMEFDEVLFDREYDLSNLKLVGIPDFNSGAMENKGLMIFNDVRLLVDAQSGTDRTHRDVATVIGHEYFHNWSGNRVTIRNWFEIALKEAFTDLRAMLFSEWLFGAGFVRPKSVLALRENQFPEETSEKGHPIIVESYVDAHSIYDATTYTKGREVFRTLKNYIDTLMPGGFRDVQNHYFSRYDGQAVTFRELLNAADDVLRNVGHDLKTFERWFHQQGTPVVTAQVQYDEAKELAEIKVTQCCIHPKTGEAQQPLLIPFSIELLGLNGDIIHPKFSCILDQEIAIFQLASHEKPTPVFMHGFTAPVIFEHDYSMEDLARIVKYSDDSFCRWEAGQKYSLMALKEIADRLERDPLLEYKAQQGQFLFADLQQLYGEALNSPHLSPLAKAQLLEIPSIRAISQEFKRYDFERLGQLRDLFIVQLAHFCKPVLEKLLKEYPAPISYEPTPEQMQIRELRNECLALLAPIDEVYKKMNFEKYQTATNFDDAVSSFNLCLKTGQPFKEWVIEDSYYKWKGDKAVFNFWLTSQAVAPDCELEDLVKLELVKGYDRKNPNHVRSVFRAYISNLKCYHRVSGEGYSYIVSKIIEIARNNPYLAHNYIAVPAFLDFDKLPPPQQSLMAHELERLRNHEDAPPQTRDLVDKMLKRYHKTTEQEN